MRGLKETMKSNFNNDGLDIDGCENVLIENCDLDSGDDAICLKSSLNPCRNIVVRGCKVSSNTAPLKFGTSSRGGFIDVTVTNCYFYDSPMGAIKLQLVDGGRLENVDISRIVMENVGNPIFIRLGNRDNTYADAPMATMMLSEHSRTCGYGTWLQRSRLRIALRRLRRNTSKRDVEDSPEITDREKSTAGPIMITGIPEHFVEDVVLENITISYPAMALSRMLIELCLKTSIGIRSNFSSECCHPGEPISVTHARLYSKMSN